METIGTVVDKLITADLKMWFLQEDLYEVRRMDFEEFKRRYSNDQGMKTIFNILKRACDQNIQRNDLIKELDEIIDQAIKAGGNKAIDQHKTY